MKLRTMLLVGALAVGTSALAFMSPSMYGGSEGPSEKTMAQDFSLTGLDGKPYSLAAFKGKVIVLEWTNPGCPFVKRQYGNAEGMAALQKKYTEQGVVWLTICSTNPEHGEYFADDAMRTQYETWHAAQTAILTDKDGRVGHMWGAKTTPHMFVINRDFSVVYQGAIDNNPRGSKPAAEVVNYVDKALTAVLAGTPVETASTQPYGCSVKYAN